MSINTLDFFVFFTIIALLYYIIPSKFKNIILLISNLLFFSLLTPLALPVLLFTSILNFIFSKLIYSYKDKMILTISILFNISSIFLFKYYNSYSDNFTALLNKIHITIDLPTFPLIAPVGISFYTLGVIAYLIDLYRERVPLEKSFINFSVYVSFFLTLLSGPIEKSNSFLPQLKKERKFNYDDVFFGISKIILGLFKKAVIADRLAIYINEVFNNSGLYSGWFFTLSVFLYAFQLYCDFSGYSDMALGFAKILSIDLTVNFKTPYFSQNIQEFWRRWHISLSNFLRDYVYFSLGGSRVSKYRSILNRFLVFIVSGLWHGSNPAFLIWGGLHGFYNFIYYKFKDTKFYTSKSILFKALRIVSTFIIVDFAWLFFRASNLKLSINIIKSILANSNFITFKDAIALFSINQWLVILISLIILYIYDLRLYKNKILSDNKTIILNIIFIAFIVLFGKTNTSDFLYFKF